MMTMKKKKKKKRTVMVIQKGHTRRCSGNDSTSDAMNETLKQTRARERERERERDRKETREQEQERERVGFGKTDASYIRCTSFGVTVG